MEPTNTDTFNEEAHRVVTNTDTFSEEAHRVVVQGCNVC